MTTTILLVRHAHCDHIGRFLAGRTADIGLSATGQEEAARLAVRIAAMRPDGIITSPRLRAMQTAAAIASACGISTVANDPALDEIDFGVWSGQPFDQLERDPEWRRWNAARSQACPPGGEPMQEVRRRTGALIASECKHAQEKRLVLVSHCDVIKAILMDVMGLHTDDWAAFEIAPASVSTFVFGDEAARVLTINETAD